MERVLVTHPAAHGTASSSSALRDKLLAIALQLGARHVPTWSEAERELARKRALPAVSEAELWAIRDRIRAGDDPLGDAVMSLSPEARRPSGITYTPQPLIDAMTGWAMQAGNPSVIVDPGCGSGRFLVSAGQRFPGADLVGVELDPLGSILARAQLAVVGLSDRARVLHQDYRQPLRLGTASKLFLGNPPYVRHHQLEPSAKRWLVETARRYGFAASKLAGLHVHFFLATLEHSSPGDYGAFVTSAEWLDVNYGRLVRELLLSNLGGSAIHVIAPEARPFEGTATTAAITCFHVGRTPSSLRFRRIDSVGALGRLQGGTQVTAARLAEAPRWTPLMRTPTRIPEGYIELGELCRVHRGAVTGANATWVTRHDDPQLPASVLFPSITRARELFLAGDQLVSADGLRVVIDLPRDLDVLESSERVLVERFLRRAQRAGAAEGYIARNRNPWWSVKLRHPAPILATYMARRPPAFVLNLAEARHINIAHGLYPRQPLPQQALHRLAAALRRIATRAQGRTYAGGLTKFEPREMERLPVPDLPSLLST